MRLADYLTDRSITEAAFAKKLEVEASTIHRVAKGDRRPSWALMEAIRHATGGAVQPNDFFADEPAAVPLARAS